MVQARATEQQRTAATKPTTDDDEDETRDVDGGGNRTTTSSNLHPDDTTLDVESLVSKRSFQVKAGSLVLTTVFYLLLCSVIPLIVILCTVLLARKGKQQITALQNTTQSNLHNPSDTSIIP